MENTYQNKDLLDAEERNEEYVEYARLNKGKHKPDTLFLYLTVIIGTLPMIITGGSITWSSSAILKLLSNDTAINPIGRPIVTSEISMLIGVPSLVSLMVCSILQILADRLGRKLSLQIFNFGTLLGFIGTAYSTTMFQLMIYITVYSTFIIGSNIVLPIYITEICENHNRGKYGTLLWISLSLGELYSFIVGSQFNFKNFTLMVALPTIPFLIFFSFVPESPVNLLLKGKEEECIQALRRLRSNKSDKELYKDLDDIREGLGTSDTDNKLKIVQTFTVKEARKGLILSAIPICVQFFCGLPIVMSLMEPIFDGSNTLVSSNTIAISVGIVKTTSFLANSMIVERFDRKVLLVVSSTGTGIVISILGIYFYLMEINSPLLSKLQLVPIITILLYVIFFALGLGSLPTIIGTELFTSDLRATANVLLTNILGPVFLGYSIAFPYAASTLGLHWCLWMFGFSCFLGAVLMYTFLPETRGKSIAEIQELLKHH